MLNMQETEANETTTIIEAHNIAKLIIPLVICLIERPIT